MRHDISLSEKWAYKYNKDWGEEAHRGKELEALDKRGGVKVQVTGLKEIYNRSMIRKISH